MNTEQTTEQKILHSATAIFIREGYAGARMQAIADHAGINKALLHYYFKSKDKLFEKIFESKYQMLLPKLQNILNEKVTIFEVVDKIIDAYLDMLSENPYLPALVISTVNHHPEFLKKIPAALPTLVQAKFQEAIQSGIIKPINPVQFFISLISLCIAPYAMKPMIMHMMQMDEKTFLYTVEQRRAIVKTYMRDILKS